MESDKIKESRLEEHYNSIIDNQPHEQEPLSNQERAYRRGALQSIEFMLASLPKEATREEIIEHIAKWQQKLTKYRGDTATRLLGTYCETIRREMLDLPEPIYHMKY